MTAISPSDVSYWNLYQDEPEAIRLNPKYTNAYINRGHAYGYLGQYERAIQDYDEAIQIDPLAADAYYHRGRAYQELGRQEHAERDLAKAKALGYES